MSKTLDVNEITAHSEAANEDGENSRTDQKGLDDQSERFTSPSINVAPTSLNEITDQPASVLTTDQQSDERIENLAILFRYFLEAAPHKSVPNCTHPVWLTYLDEAESFYRERAKGWKKRVDVFLLFAGASSSIITTFISQASQSLQRDNTQTFASLFFKTFQIQLAQSNGMSTIMIPNSTMNPNSLFTPSTDAVLVNSLWFTSLALTLSAALFAVLVKQWLYSHLSSIPGTVNSRVRARQLRFNDVELWKVEAIIELLPILLRLAVGMFLTGIIILLLSVDVHMAGIMDFILGIIYSLYFISAILPIWYSEILPIWYSEILPIWYSEYRYTTSLMIYTGILFILRRVLQTTTVTPNGGFQAVWRKINPKARLTAEHLVHYAENFIGHGFRFISKLAGAVGRGVQRFRSTISSGNLRKFTEWREENIKKAVKDATYLGFETVNWLYATSLNRSVHRIIAWCAAVHPIIRERFYWRAVRDLFPVLEVGKPNVMDIRHGLSLGLPTHEYVHWELLPYISDVVESRLGEGEYQTYLRVVETVLQFKEERRTLFDAINGDSSLPLVMWCYLLKKTSTDATVAVHILTHGTRSLFDWKFDPTRELIRNAGLVRFDSEELGWWKFEHLFRYFALGKPECSSEFETYETGYLLLIVIYRNLTSDDPLITDKEQRQESLGNVFFSFWLYFGRPRRLEDALHFFTEICCVDLFWCESMTDHARFWAVDTLYGMNFSITDMDNCLSFMDLHNLSLIYQWYSQDLHSNFSQITLPLFALLLMSQNRHHLSTILLNDADVVSHFSKCLHNLANYSNIEEEISLYLILDLLKSVDPENPLFTILHDPSVLVQLWRLLVYSKSETERYFLLVKSKIDREKSDMLFAAMNELARSSDNLDNLPYRCRRDSEYKDYLLSALPASAREFGQLVGVFHTQHEATADKSAPENSASDKDHDIEERAQVSERQNHHSVADSMKKVFDQRHPVK